MNDKLYTIPAEVLEATVKVLTNYQTRLEKEASILAQETNTATQVEDHRKLIEIVRRLAAFYSKLKATEG